MTAAALPPTPVKPSPLAAEPLRIAYVMYTLVSAIIAVLLIGEFIDARIGGVITGVAAAVYAAVNELLVRPAVTPVVTAAAKVEEALYTPVPGTPPAAVTTETPPT